MILKAGSIRSMTGVQCRDGGMALVLLLLLAYLPAHHSGILTAAIAIHILNMMWPRMLAPFAALWFGLSHVLGRVVSTVVLTIVYVVLVVPVGFIRRAAGKDALRLRGFKVGRGSIMLVRNHSFTAKDMETPY